MDGASALVAVTTLEPGDDCANGGTRIETGLDDDGDGTLDASEVDSTSDVCSGTGGAAGAALIATTDLALGDASCPGGGVQIDVGVDDGDPSGTAGDGVLDAGEIEGTETVCNGLDGVGASPFEIVTYDGIDLNVVPSVTGPSVRAQVIGRYRGGSFDAGAAEIVDWDGETGFAYVTNASSGLVEVVDFDDSTPALVEILDPGDDLATNGLLGGRTAGGINSLVIFDAPTGPTRSLAVAVEADPSTDDGWIVVYDISGTPTFTNAVDAGALPDMVTATPDGATLLVANEGEPDGVDPEGSISVIDVSGDLSVLSAAEVTEVGFADFNVGGSREAELPAEVIIAPEDPSSTVAQDLEPEYIAVSPDGATAYVSLQEANAVAIVDVAAPSVSAIVALGFKDHSLPGNELDASDRDGAVNIRSWPVLGMYQPDSLATYAVGGATYVLSANEGDARDFSEARVEDIGDGDELGATFMPADTSFGMAEELEMAMNLGRLEIQTQLGVTDAGCLSDGDLSDCVYDRVYAYGARSFSIWDGATGALVWDSGNAFEVITASALGTAFNASNDENGGDSRSDAKGPEPEAITVGEIAGRWYAFIGLERMGGIMTYDVTDPTAPTFAGYFLSRDLTLGDEIETDPEVDLGPESIVFIPASESLTRNPMLLVGNEVSGRPR